MAPSEGFASIAGAGKPNAGKIHEFVLGGEHATGRKGIDMKRLGAILGK
jgi:hypothetical protein